MLDFIRKMSKGNTGSCAVVGGIYGLFDPGVLFWSRPRSILECDAQLVLCSPGCVFELPVLACVVAA